MQRYFTSSHNDATKSDKALSPTHIFWGSALLAILVVFRFRESELGCCRSSAFAGGGVLRFRVCVLVRLAVWDAGSVFQKPCRLEADIGAGDGGRPYVAYPSFLRS